MSFSRRRFLVEGGLLAAGCGGAWLLRDFVLWPKPKVGAAAEPEWLPFARRRALATVMVEAFGARFAALIDSGAQRSALDRSFAERLGVKASIPLPMIAFGVSGRPQLGGGVRLELNIGGLSVTGLTAAVLELGPIAGADGLSTPLILGQDLLETVAAEIDFPGRRLRLLPAEDYTAPPGARLAPARRKGRGLFATVELDGAPVEALIDTGASAALSLSAASAAAKALPPPVRSENAVVLGGVVASQVVEGRTVTFAGETFHDLEVQVQQSSGPVGMPEAIIGVELLARAPISLDLSRGKLAVLAS